MMPIPCVCYCLFGFLWDADSKVEWALDLVCLSDSAFSAVGGQQ